MLRQDSKPQHRNSILICAIVLLCVIFCHAPRTPAQDSTDYQQQRQRAMQLYDQNKFTEAIPILEDLVKIRSGDSIVWERLGWATLVASGSIKDPEERKRARSRARTALVRAKELGDDSDLLRAGLEALSGPDPTELTFSNNKEADAAMREGEEAHARGDLDKAIAAYQRALQLDPKLYLAALYTGDMYFKKGYQARASDTRVKDELIDKAGEWFAKAIAIEENIETAHRYWGDALMLQGKQQEALAKFINAIIADPGNRNGYMGLSQWGERNQVGLGHPKIEIPVKLSLAGDRKLDVSFDPALRDSPDGSGAWEQYGLVRARWVAEDFAKAYPNETAYRHTLREEAEALRKVAEAASQWQKAGRVKMLSPSLAVLVKLSEAGLLEPYIFFARVDQGIARDYPAYRQANRDKLRRYWKEFVIQQ